VIDGLKSIRVKEHVKAFILPFSVVFGLTCLCACSHGPKQSSEPAASVKEESGPIETYTGTVVKTDEGYRFKPEKDPENLQRFTRSKRGANLASDEIDLRKYFGKTLVVKGDYRHGWLLRATVLGQWLRPGEPRGATLLGPEPVPAQPR
jgi:hypothetical protein